MPSEEPFRSGSQPVKGLPPVTPPSGKFMAQLFLVPLAIVAGIALVFFGIIWMFSGVLGSPQTPAQFLDKLDRSNADVRWRAAADLAQVLLRDDQLASNPRFALDLTERLRKAMDSAAAAEKPLAERLSKHQRLVERLSRLVQNEPDQGPADDEEWKALKKDWERLEPEHNYVLYLSACLGNVCLPAGAPLLSELAMKEPVAVNVIVTLQRRRAVWALANLGDSLKRFDKLPASRQAAVLAELEEETRSATGDRQRWAQETREYLRKRQAGAKTALGVDAALVQCAEDAQDPFLRELAGFAMGFWEGTPEENRRMDKALMALTSDAGNSDETLAKMFEPRNDREKGSVPITRKHPASRIHYNATVALARRGSDGDYLGMLEEMLDEEAQRNNHRLKRPNGQEDPDEATAYLTVISALKAVAELHGKKPDRLTKSPSLRAAVERLTQSPNAAVRTEAERIRIALGSNE